MTHWTHKPHVAEIHLPTILGGTKPTYRLYIEFVLCFVTVSHFTLKLS